MKRINQAVKDRRRSSTVEKRAGRAALRVNASQPWLIRW